MCVRVIFLLHWNAQGESRPSCLRRLNGMCNGQSRFTTVERVAPPDSAMVFRYSAAVLPFKAQGGSRSGIA